MESGQDPENGSRTLMELVAGASGYPVEELPADRTLSGLGISSFGVMRLVLALEEEFEVELSGEQLIELTTTPTGDLYEIVLRARQASLD